MPSEFALIDRHFKRPPRHSILGVGDDAAIVRPAPGMDIVMTTDMLIAGTHFLPDDMPFNLGWKTLAVNVSDLAAMGAQPRWALLGLALPTEKALDDPWLAAYAEGLFDCAEAFGIDLIGGDTTRGPLTFSITLFGEISTNRALLRSNAQPDDDVWISGNPGLAALGLAQRQGRCQLPPALHDRCLDALDRPQPRLALGQALSQQALAHAAIDVSDGLLADLGHILEQSQLAATLHFDRLPAAALATDIDRQLAANCLLAGGDDYELLFTASRTHHEKILALSKQLQLPLHCIGTVHTMLDSPARQIRVLDADGQEIQCLRHGHDHFADAHLPADDETDR
ncbi:MAG: thiamine-phosphate kinase [Sterolibacterium sp.]|nr:thiamine-phosphate kinase [Sterolibacterium sp.]